MSNWITSAGAASLGALSRLSVSQDCWFDPYGVGDSSCNGIISGVDPLINGVVELLLCHVGFGCFSALFRLDFVGHSLMISPGSLHLLQVVM